MSDWQKVNIDSGSKLFKVHVFTYMHAGVIYALEINEFSDGTCTGHGEHSTDKSNVVEPVNGPSVRECVQALVDRIGKRGG